MGMEGSGKTAFRRRLQKLSKPLETGGSTKVFTKSRLDVNKFPNHDVKVIETGNQPDAYQTRKEWGKTVPYVHGLTLILDASRQNYMDESMEAFKRILRKKSAQGKPA